MRHIQHLNSNQILTRLFIAIVGLSTWACSPKTISSCVDITNPKLKNERVSHRTTQSKKSKSISKASKRLDEVVKKMPFDNLLASSDGISEALPIHEYLREYPNLYTINSDSVPDDHLNTEIEELQKSVNELKAQYESQKENFETNSELSPSGDRRIDPKHKKAKTLAIVSFASIFGVLLLGLLAIIPGIITGFMSLKRYKQITNKQGRWMAVAGVVTHITLLVLSLLLVIIVLLAFQAWQNQ